MMPPAPAANRDAPLEADYWAESRRPLTSLAFVAPILAIYEVGVLVLGPQAMRNGADVWLRRVLELLDLGQYFLLPVLVVSILLGWHHTTRQPWRVSRPVLSGMVVECFLLAVCLRLALQAEAMVLQSLAGALSPQPVSTSLVLDTSGRLAGLVGYLGAGVYEELLFRLVLLAPTVRALQRGGLTQDKAVLAAVAATSLIFALAHYVGPYGDPIELGRFAFWFGFVFRFIAGVFFSGLFVFRGFGIAVGTHAAYDVLVQLW
ncbi:MAG: CPBP family intramembrane metalloprotease [Thermoguttaceae bacterium]|jgi:membrane protease YdiL (CAAX protease family)|nr:CPBP family intramembrane metalloprotease [Thermoguttaceae bacterium]